MEIDLSQAYARNIASPFSGTEIEQIQAFTIEIADATRELILKLWRGGSFHETL